MAHYRERWAHHVRVISNVCQKCRAQNSSRRSSISLSNIPKDTIVSLVDYEVYRQTIYVFLWLFYTFCCVGTQSPFNLHQKRTKRSRNEISKIKWKTILILKIKEMLTSRLFLKLDTRFDTRAHLIYGVQFYNIFILLAHNLIYWIMTDVWLIFQRAHNTQI